MPHEQNVNISCSRHGPPGFPGDDPFIGLCSRMAPSFQIIGAMNRIMAEHFGVDPFFSRETCPGCGSGTDHPPGVIIGEEKEFFGE